MRFLLALIAVLPLAAQEAPAPAAAAPLEKTAAAAPAEEKAESPAPTSEPSLTGSVDVGYRWLTDIHGNFQSYRSVINLGEGPKLFGADFVLQGKRLFDRIDVNGFGWGGDPYSTVHVGAQKARVYDFRFDYRNISYFNALPSFANPRAPGGFDEQAFDIQRRIFNINLDFRPGSHIIPYLAFDRSAGSGRGIDTWLTDSSNEYPVPSLLDDHLNNFRGGVRFEYNRFHITLEQGGTTFDDNTREYENTRNLGDRTAPLLGQTLTLTNLAAAYRVSGNSIYQRGLLTATPASWVTFSGQFLFSQPKTDVQYADQATGNFLSLSSLLAYTGINDLASGTAKQPHVTGNAGFELKPFRRLRIVESWMTDRYHDTSFGLFSSQIAATTPQATVLPDLQVVNYNQNQVDAMFEAASRVTLRAGYRHVWGDATVRAGQLSQTGSFASGELKRDVALAGAYFRPVSKMRVNLDFERGLSDQVYFRTSLNDYYKTRARAQYQATTSLSLQASFTLLNSQNPAPAVRYDFQTQDEALSFFWSPNQGKRFTFSGEYDHTQLHSSIQYLSLPFLDSAVSAYRERAHTATSTIDVAIPGLGAHSPRLAAGGSLFVSSGSRPTRFYQPLVRLSLPISKHVAWNTEWRWYGMGEEFYIYEGFRTHAFTTGLRLTR